MAWLGLIAQMNKGTKSLRKIDLVQRISSVVPDQIVNCKAIRTKQCKYNIKCKCNNVFEYNHTLLTQNSGAGWMGI